MYQRHKDTMLLEEAYKATQLTQHLPKLTVKQIQLVVENASAAELEVIEEFLGGIKNVARGAKEGAQRVGQAVGGAARGAGRAVGGAARGAGQAVGQAARGAGQAVGQAARGAGQAVGDAARGAGQAVKAGTRQAGANVKDMWQTGEAKASAEKRKSQLVNQLAQLEELFAAHLAEAPESRLAKKFAKTKLDQITIGSLKRALAATASVKKAAAHDARQGGVLGGVTAAAQRAYEKEQKARAGAPPTGATPAPA